MRGGGSHQRVGDLGVDVVERVGGLVEVVERGGVADEIGARVDGGAQVAVIDAVDGVSRLVGDVLMAARSEADDDDRAVAVRRRASASRSAETHDRGGRGVERSVA